MAASAQRVPLGARPARRADAPLLAALGVMAASVLWSWGPGSLPSGLALSALGLLAATAVMVVAASAPRTDSEAAALFALFCIAWLAAGMLNAGVALVQVFMPEWADGNWIAPSGIVGRAVGNLRQPNHLSSLLLWAAIAAVALVTLRRLPWQAGAGLLALMVLGVVLTASRTGLVSVLLLALWSLVDRRLPRAARLLLLSAPLLYALAWTGMSVWSDAAQHTFGGAARLAETDVSGSRFGIWRDTLTLIRQQPWTGVGFGMFNYAWTLTPLPGRPVAFFDHTHNLPLQLAAEIGLPAAALVLLLLAAALWRAVIGAGRNQGSTGDAANASAITDASQAQRAAVAMVLMTLLHSLLEYPLWYAYFLLPAAWAWGFALRGAPAAVGIGPAARRRGLPLLRTAGLALMAAAVLSVADYARVAAIFEAAPGDAPLAQRIESGQRSVLFAHHADYAAVTSDVVMPGWSADTGGPQAQQAFAGATHYLLDTRLMMAWASALAAAGDVDGARHLAQRLREFRNPLAEPFFADCAAPAAGSTGAAAAAEPNGPNPNAADAGDVPPISQPKPAGPLPFQCSAPNRVLGWRDFQDNLQIKRLRAP